MVCRPEKWVNDQLGLLDLPEQIQKYVDEGTINAANALSLRKLPKDRILDYLQAAMTESPEVFSPKIEEAVKELRSAANTGVKAGPPEFKAVAKPRKPSAFKQAIEEFNRTGTIADLRSMIDVQGISNPFDAVVATLQWALHLDPISVEAERAKWNAEQAVKAEAKRQREEEKAAKKQADAAKEIQNAVNSELAA